MRPRYKLSVNKNNDDILLDILNMDKEYVDLKNETLAKISRNIKKDVKNPSFKFDKWSILVTSCLGLVIYNLLKKYLNL